MCLISLRFFSVNVPLTQVIVWNPFIFWSSLFTFPLETSPLCTTGFILEASGNFLRAWCLLLKTTIKKSTMVFQVILFTFFYMTSAFIWHLVLLKFFCPVWLYLQCFSFLHSVRCGKTDGNKEERYVCAPTDKILEGVPVLFNVVVLSS